MKHRPSYRLSTRQGPTSKAESWTSCQTSQKWDAAGKSFLNSPHRRMPYRTINQVDRVSCQHLASWRLEQLSPKICSAMRVSIVRHIFGTCHTLKRKYLLTPLMAAFTAQKIEDEIRRDETRWDEPQRSYWVSKDQLEDPTPGFHWAKQISQIHSKSL